MNEPPKSPDSAIWQAALKEGEHEVLKFDPAAVRKALRDSRKRHTVRVKAVLP